jgi:hypothetical protein
MYKFSSVFFIHYRHSAHDAIIPRCHPELLGIMMCNCTMYFGVRDLVYLKEDLTLRKYERSGTCALNFFRQISSIFYFCRFI